VVQGVPPLQAARVGDIGRRVGVEAGREDPQAAEGAALILAQRRIGTLDRGLQRLLATDGVGPAAGQQLEPLIQQPGDLGRARRRHPSGRRQISPTAATLEGLRKKSPRAAAACCANKTTASLAPAATMVASGGGSDSRRSPNTCSRPR
jgi:hypothetical protein